MFGVLGYFIFKRKKVIYLFNLAANAFVNRDLLYILERLFKIFPVLGLSRGFLCTH